MLRFAILALDPGSRCARASARAALVRDRSHVRCRVISCELCVERAADAVRSLPRLRGRVGVGACMHECLSMLCTSLYVCPLPVPPPQAGEGTLEPLGRFVRPRMLTRAKRVAFSASRMPSLMLTRITCRSRICGNGRRAGTIVTQNKHEETPCGHLA
jgi:hypothetical protein